MTKTSYESLTFSLFRNMSHVAERTYHRIKTGQRPDMSMWLIYWHDCDNDTGWGKCSYLYASPYII